LLLDSNITTIVKRDARRGVRNFIDLTFGERVALGDFVLRWFDAQSLHDDAAILHGQVPEVRYGGVLQDRRVLELLEIGWGGTIRTFV
jgi:hypothetical protein